MTTQLTPMQDFEQKVKERLAKDIGNLIPDEALKNLVERSVEETFFKTRTVAKTNGYGTQEIPSAFQQEVGKLVQPSFEKAVKKWMKDNDERIGKEINDFLNKSAEQVFLNAIGNVFRSNLQNLQWKIQDDINNKFQNM